MQADGRIGDTAENVRQWQMDLTVYDRTSTLSYTEQSALAEVQQRRARRANGGLWPHHLYASLERFLCPLCDAVAAIGTPVKYRGHAIGLLLAAMHQRQTAFWAWSPDEWHVVVRESNHSHISRQPMLAVAYLLCGVSDLPLELPRFKCRTFARKIFGRTAIDMSVQRVGAELLRWGYSQSMTAAIRQVLCLLLLLGRSPRLEDITPAAIAAVLEAGPRSHRRDAVMVVSRILVGLGLLPTLPAMPSSGSTDLTGLTEMPSALVTASSVGTRASVPSPGAASGVSGVSTEWAEWCQRWRNTSTLGDKSRQNFYYRLLKAGRWLAMSHPGVVDPHQWTRELAAEYVAAVNHMVVGQWTNAPTYRDIARLGKPLGAQAKEHHLVAMRTFFRDGQEWGWFPRHFDPGRVFATPRALRSLIGPNPRVIADDIWAKLLSAGLNLTAKDLPSKRLGRGASYPLEMVRAVTVTWLFTGLRSAELRRLRVGCVRWQREEVVVAGTLEVLPRDAICWLDVPVNKTNTAFTKAVDGIVGEAIMAWERVRPMQLPAHDAKTGEVVQYLFSQHNRQLGPTYLNRWLIPLLCAKANVPMSDARGNITSHRARSTIASQLANAKEPLTLLELMEWLGHRKPESTLHYVKTAPTRLAKAYADAGYFARNLRMVDVLIDREAVTSGHAAAGASWRFYDLGHGYCTYDFFEQCPHRMACAKCDFYLPKASSQAQAVEAKANLLRMKQEIPLTDDERAAVDDGLAALEQLCAKLADVPTPAGPTPREMDAVGRHMLPVMQPSGGAPSATVKRGL
jgi:integrase